MKKEMTIKDIQNVSLNILIDIHNFCESNNIRYSLAGGTLIGAVRHKGFIPWDDDIDIIMPRPDYNRFLQIYNSDNGYQLIARDAGDKSVDIMFGRVCDMHNTLVETSVPWCDKKTGVFIDIFPLDGVPDNRDEAEMKIKKMKKLWRLSFIQRSVKKPISEIPTFSKKIKYIIKLPILFLGDIIGRLNDQCKQLEFGTTGHYANLAFLQYGMREYHRISVFDSLVKVPFEGYEFYAMVGYDEVLKEKFGDYMQLPPVEQRVNKHDFEKFYWI